MSIENNELVSPGQQILKQLDHKVDLAVVEFKESPIWQTISSPESFLDLINAIIREVYWESIYISRIRPKLVFE